MVQLEDPKWKELVHAYGSAADIPALLGALEAFPASENYKDEPWYSLWSTLCHQGDVYSASFAAVPHIVAIAGSNPSKASYNYFLLPASIEIARVTKSISIPRELEEPYFQALRLIPQIVGATAERDWDEAFCISALAGIAAAKSYTSLAEVLRELDRDTVPTVLKFLFNR